MSENKKPEAEILLDKQLEMAPKTKKSNIKIKKAYSVQYSQTQISVIDYLKCNRKSVDGVIQHALLRLDPRSQACYSSVV